MGYYVENASWCLGCAQCILLIVRAIIFVGRRDGAAPLGGDVCASWGIWKLRCMVSLCRLCVAWGW